MVFGLENTSMSLNQIWRHIIPLCGIRVIFSQFFNHDKDKRGYKSTAVTFSFVEIEKVIEERKFIVDNFANPQESC